MSDAPMSDQTVPPAVPTTPQQGTDSNGPLVWRCPTCGLKRKTWRAASRHEVNTGHSVHREQQS